MRILIILMLLATTQAHAVNPVELTCEGSEQVLDGAINGDFVINWTSTEPHRTCDGYISTHCATLLTETFLEDCGRDWLIEFTSPTHPGLVLECEAPSGGSPFIHSCVALYENWGMSCDGSYGADLRYCVSAMVSWRSTLARYWHVGSGRVYDLLEWRQTWQDHQP